MVCQGDLFGTGLLGVLRSRCGCEEVWVVVTMVMAHRVSRLCMELNVSVNQNKVLRLKC